MFDGTPYISQSDYHCIIREDCNLCQLVNCSVTAKANNKMSQKPGEKINCLAIRDIKGYSWIVFFCIYTDINKTKIKVSIQRVGWGRGRDGCLIQFPCK